MRGGGRAGAGAAGVEGRRPRAAEEATATGAERKARAAVARATVVQESGRRQEATVAVENFGSLTAQCHKWPPVSRSEPRTGSIYTHISHGLSHAPRLKVGGGIKLVDSPVRGSDRDTGGHL